MEKKKPPIIAAEGSNSSELKDDGQKMFASEYRLSSSPYSYDNSSTPTLNEVFFIDGGLDDIDVLISSLPADATFFVLDSFQNGIEQMAEILSGYVDLSAIHVLSHGDAGSLSLGPTVLNQSSLDVYSNLLATIGGALSATGDLLLYGCNVAEGEMGQAFIQQLAKATGADVAASTDLTGSALRGGDWTLEASTGTIETDIGRGASTPQSYGGLLVTPDFNRDYELARLSNIAYRDDLITGSYYATEWKMIIDSIQYYEVESGFRAFAFENINTGKIVISYRGTDPTASMGDDLPADNAIAGVPLWNDWDDQFTYAIEFVKEVLKTESYEDILVTGHSLGGACAQVVSQMFGFKGATFDPGGAQNLVESVEFKEIAADLHSTYLDIDPVTGKGVPAGFYNYIVNNSVVSSVSGDDVGDSVLIFNDLMEDFFEPSTIWDSNPLFSVVYLPMLILKLHSIDEIERLLFEKKAGTVLARLTVERDENATAAQNGDIGLSNTSTTEGVIEYYCYPTRTVPVFANNRDNIVYGFGANDIIYSFDGNDTIYGDDGNDTIYAAQGNDIIYGGGGFDTIYAGSGDDTIYDQGYSQGNSNNIDGGSGYDTLTIDASNYNGYYRGVHYIIKDSNNIDVWYDNNRSFSDISSALQNTVSFSLGTLVGTSYLKVILDTYSNIEHVNLLTTQYSDLLIDQGGGDYNGQGGVDTFYADLSDQTEAVIWDNSVTSQTVTLPDGATVVNVQRMLLATGSGDDVIKNTHTSNTNDYFDLGAGNDYLEAGEGNDTIYGGDGNDVLKGGGGFDTIYAGNGDDTIYDQGYSQGNSNNIDGGSGYDTLTIDASNYDGYYRGVHYIIKDSNNIDVWYDNNRSFSDISSALENTGSFSLGTLIGTSYLKVILDTYSNIEHVNLITTSASDLLIDQGGGAYNGQGGVDTFYADLSDETEAVTWDNSVTSQTVTLPDGATVVNVERLLLATGSGADVIKNTHSSNTNDYFDLGAGNDYLEAGEGNDTIYGGDGNDVLKGGGGFDTIYAGSGDDTIYDQGYSQGNSNNIDGGSGNDTLTIDASNYNGYYRGVHYIIKDSNNIDIWYDNNRSFSDISSALQNTVSFSLGTLVGTSYLKVILDTYSNIEHVNLLTTQYSDLLIDQGGGDYNGQGGVDTFYADLSDQTEAVIWDNSVTSQTVTLPDGTTVVNVERLLLATGSGSDVIKNTNSSNTNDYFDLGAGNDSVDVGGGNDTILGGVGRDNLAGGSGNDIYRYSTKDDSTVASYDTITDFAIGDSIEFTGMADMRLLTGAFQWQGTLQTTLTAIQNDNYLANSLVFFNDGTDGWLYVRGAGMGTDFESSLIKLQGRAVTLGASDISGESGTFSRPVLSVSAASANLLEGNAGACTSFTFTVSRSGDLNGTSSATWSLAGSGTNPANAADLFGGNLSGGTVSFAVGESSKTVTVDIAGDDVIEPDETFALTLSNPTGATLGTASATGTIRNDDCTLAIAAGSASKSEGNGTGSTSFTFTVTRGGYANTTTSVNWSVAGSGAQPGNAADFTGGIMPGGTLNFAAGTTSKTITVNIARDDKTEADETFAVILSDAVGSTIIVGSATGTILTDDNTMRIGTAKAEILTGTADDDALCGLAGNDTLNGLAGNDLLDGGQGADRLAGGLDNDTYVVDNLGDVVTENTNSGLDVVEASTSAILAANVENLILTGSGNINGTGNTMGNVLTGNSGSNILDGKSGLDTFVGGMGDDTYLLDQEGELASITENAAEGTDLLKIGYGNSSTILAKSISLAGNLANIDQVALMGTGLFNIIGNNLDNVLTGNASVNALEGGAGNDILDGKAGKDTLIGGMGNDIYVIDNIGDIITENDGEGIDTVQAGLTWTLGNNLDNLTLTGALAINCTGNGMNNALIGNKAANRLDGGLGADTLIGGLGNDTYMVDDGGDTITETSVLASEIDTVLAKIDWTLGNNLENLVLTGSNSINGTGNTLKNTLTGNTAANCLDGGLGADKMLGGAGDDIYIVDNPGDFVTETTNSGLDTVEASISYTLGANVENLLLTGFGNINGTGNTQSNVLTGNDGNNILDGKTGLDTFVGGIGNDTYVLNLEGELATITENAGEGTDMLKIGYGNSLTTVAKVISLTDNLVNIEHVTLLGAGLFNIAGNDLDNALTGNASINSLLGGSGNDTLDGKGGKDNLIGGEGNDTYVIDNTGDLITENAGEGTDTVRTTLTSNLGDNLENLTLIGISAINGTGNGLDNILTGNNAANRLDGGIGNDTLSGGLGNDILTGGEGQDSFLFNTSLNRTTNKDSIVDYTVTDDTIVLDNSIFKKLSESGTLSEDNFRGSNNGAASDATDYILYNTTTGALFYDSDGSGVATAIQFASLTSKPTLSANEFLVV